MELRVETAVGVPLDYVGESRLITQVLKSRQPIPAGGGDGRRRRQSKPWKDSTFHTSLWGWRKEAPSQGTRVAAEAGSIPQL